MQLQTQQYGTVPVVSRERLLDAVLDGVAFIDRAGGTLTVVVGRQQTDIPGEAVTTGAIVEWKSGPRAPTEPEVSSPFTVSEAPQPAPEPEVAEVVEHADVEPLDEAAPLDDVGDGLVPLEDEDLEAIPAEMR